MVIYIVGGCIRGYNILEYVQSRNDMETLGPTWAYIILKLFLIFCYQLDFPNYYFRPNLYIAYSI